MERAMSKTSLNRNYNMTITQFWDQALIEKYNYTGPRYTSYPTALEFNDNFNDQDFLSAVTCYPQCPLALYIHISFCHKLCYFCGCNKLITRQTHKVTKYLDILDIEIAQ